ncbi:hypothetical protein C1H69_15820 [Billgrantia endophytica]|uniref:Uncharacterized protein n=2 Tax=Billgrantia endophytica TaxID=2033802 RepID=A0A2N7U0G7_9GAMM|nr:hypothetical protein C1H69_15820 [Halomonas endophytica]
MSLDERSLDERLQEVQPLFDEIWTALAASLRQAGIERDISVAGTPSSHAKLREDPYDHSLALYCEWHDSAGKCLGSALVYADGLVFVEFDVLLPHPRDPRWFIEAATAWGYAGALKSELRLLRALEE